MEHPQFMDFYFIHEHFTRFLSDEHKRTAPWWLFIAVTLLGMIPWVFVIPAKAGISLKSDNVIEMDPRLRGDDNSRSRNDKLFLLLWIVMPLLFFSFSNSKLVPYIFPIFPPLFIIIGNRLAAIWPAKNKRIIITMGVMASICIAANYIAPAFDKRTIKPLTEILKPQLQDEDMVVAYNSYWQDLPVYLNRNVTIAGWTGELNFGTQYTLGAKDWMISIDGFWEKCANAKNNIYVFINEEDFAAVNNNKSCWLREVSRYGKTILLKKDYNK